ncbi:hypothetical protein AO501_29140 [Mycobacterium gordonae]|uniref:Uncharacterized protein n=1 Tax=Mycobacterium gordonae TaxID=1778 RepID=A0A0Q2LK92_MYCGO|nr:hypothetical protein [Mycobacterium gordonae]KQH76290.1 hypothetical protein AO501_29140 [Mycobacterium gordonae]
MSLSEIPVKVTITEESGHSTVAIVAEAQIQGVHPSHLEDSDSRDHLANELADAVRGEFLRRASG